MTDIRETLLLSLGVSGSASALAVLIGSAFGYLLARRRFPGRSLAEGLSLLPLVLPPTVLGYYLLVTLGADSAVGRWYRALTGFDIVFSFNGIVIAATVGSLPLVIRQAQVAFAEIDRELEEAARSAGATEWQVFCHITAPLARRGLIAGAVLGFARALGDFGATLMVGGNIPGQTHTLSLAVYDAWQANEHSVALGLSMLLTAVALIVAVAAARLSEH